MKKLVVSAVAVLAAAAAWTFPSAVTFVNQGETVELAASTAEKSKVTDAGDNKYGSFVYAQGDCTLKVTVPDGADKAVMWSVLFVTNGVLTLDLTDVAAAGIPYYQHGGIVTKYNGDEGKLVVKGMDNLLCGDPSVAHERFEMRDVSFVDTDGKPLADGMVTFTNSFCLMEMPACNWALAKGGLKTAALHRQGGFDALIADGVLDVPCATLMLIGQEKLVDPAATIQVGAGRTLQTYYTDYADVSKFKTTTDTATTAADGFFWSLNGHGTDEQTVENAIALPEATSTLLVSLRTTTFDGAVSGKGKVNIGTACNQAGCRAWFKKPVAVGSFVVNPNITKNAQFDLSFFDAFTGPLTFSITNVVATFTHAGGVVTSEVSKVTGFGSAVAAGEERSYPAIVAGEGAHVKIGSATGRVRLIAGAGGRIEYGGMVIDSTGSGEGVLVVDGAIASFPAGVRVAPSPTGDADLTKLSSSALVKLDGRGVFASDFGVEPSLWLDASAEGTVSNLWLDATIEGGTPNTFPTIKVDGKNYHVTEWWSDRRPSQKSRYAYNNRHNSNNEHKYYAGVYPYVVTNGFNGKTYVSMAGGTRRYTFAGTVKPRFAVMVFGSQAGGGNALFANASLGRGGPADGAGTSMTKDAPVMTNAAFKTGHVWLDGAAVDPTATGFDGGWQIVSVKFDSATKLDGIGYLKNSSKDAGGQNYAEVILFDSALTDAQRVTVESYLARKWGLADKYQGTLATRTINAYGAGEIVLDEESATLGGVFSGKVTLTDNAVLVMPTLSAIPTETKVKGISGRTAWFDPDQKNAIKYCTGEYSQCVNVLYDRVSPKTDGSFALAADGGRAPSVETRAAGFAPARKWIQYANVNPTKMDKYNGNALRMNQMPNAYSSTVVPISDTRTVMMVMDSSQGGGCPFLDGSIGGNKIVRFNSTKNLFSKDWTAPIWSADAATTYFSSATSTYLNGVAVDGATTGFTGGPEVLTAIASKAFGLSATGGYAYKDFANAPDDTDPHTDVGEIQGEILVFNKNLSDANRQLIEAYLMYKWMGFLPAGSSYGSLEGMTVSGSGTVKAASLAALPKMGDDFTGKVAFTQPLDLAVDIDVDGTLSPIALPQVEVTGSQKLTVNFPNGRPARGWYTVVTAAGGLDGAEWSFDLPDHVRAEVTATAIRVRVSGGLLLLLK